MAKTYQEKMYDDYRRTHPTWHKDINGYETRERVRNSKEPERKKGISTYKPPTGRQPKYEYHVVERKRTAPSMGQAWVQDIKTAEKRKRTSTMLRKMNHVK